ncbi:MAG: FAD-dependent oxidoreductase [Planctomycetota bacterium]
MNSLIERDVLVAGGGSAGAAAAIAAARRGHSVLLVEEANCLGGTSTAGAVNEYFAYPEGLGDIFLGCVRELKAYGAVEPVPPREAYPGWHFNGEYLKIIWQLMAEEAGVEILLHASVVGAETDGGRVTKARVASCGQFIDVAAKHFIDATGEGDLAAQAGAEFEEGDPEGGRVLHMTLVAHMYDTGQSQPAYLPAGLQEIKGREDFPGLGYVKLPDGRVYCNSTKVMGLDPTDPFELSKAECTARRQLARVIQYLQREHFPTYAPATSGSSIGIREGRRITGDYVLTEEDILAPEGSDFEDGLCVATSQIDFHSLSKPGNAGRREEVHPYAC